MLGGYEFLSLWRLVYQVKEYCNSSYCLLLVNSRYNFHYHLQLFSILMAACVFLWGKRTRPWKRNTHPVAVRHLHLRNTFFPFNYLTTIHVLTGFQISVYLPSSRVNTRSYFIGWICAKLRILACQFHWGLLSDTWQILFRQLPSKEVFAGKVRSQKTDKKDPWRIEASLQRLQPTLMHCTMFASVPHHKWYIKINCIQCAL